MKPILSMVYSMDSTNPSMKMVTKRKKVIIQKEKKLVFGNTLIKKETKYGKRIFDLLIEQCINVLINLHFVSAD